MLEESKTSPDHSIQTLLQVIASSKPDVNLEAQQKTYANDEEIKRIRKARKQKRFKDSYEPTPEALQSIWGEVEKILKEAKTSHQDAWRIQKKYKELQADREKRVADNARIRQQCKILEKLRNDLEAKFQDKHSEYQRVCDQEKDLKQVLVGSFQDEIRQIQETVEAKCHLRAQHYNENEHLKAKIKEVQEHIEKRDSIFDNELTKHDEDKRQREQKIEEQLDSLAKNMGVNDDFEQQQATQKQEEELVDMHLQPYLNKTDEFQHIIDLTNKQFDPYKNEMTRLNTERQQFENETIKLQRKCEKSDLYLVDMVDEHLRQQDELSKQRDQIKTLQGLLATLQGQLK